MVDNIYTDSMFVSSLGGYGNDKKGKQHKKEDKLEKKELEDLKSSLSVDDEIMSINNANLNDEQKTFFSGLITKNAELSNKVRITEQRIKYLEERIDNDSYLPILSKEGIIRQLDRYIDNAKMNDTSGTVVYFWVFSCDRVRRNYGYDAANKMMRFVVEKFIDFSSNEAVIGRFNDFGIVKIIPFLVDEDVESFCDGIEKRIENLNFVYEDNLINIDICYGLAKYDSETENSYKLLRIADSNMLFKLTRGN